MGVWSRLLIKKARNVLANIKTVRKKASGRASNGCLVVERVPRRDARSRKPPTNIAAIDFSTSDCSLAYSIDGDGPFLLPLHGAELRVPTAIL